MPRMLAQGCSLTHFAETLGIGYKTAANASSHLKAKLGISRVAELVRIAIRYGLIDCEPDNASGGAVG